MAAPVKIDISDLIDKSEITSFRLAFSSCSSTSAVSCPCSPPHWRSLAELSR
jgi:hypothetical protein